MLSCDLHLLFAITPFEAVFTSRVDWRHYSWLVARDARPILRSHAPQFDQLGVGEKRVARAVGLSEAFFSKQQRTCAPENLRADKFRDVAARITLLTSAEGRARRFYLTLMLYGVIHDDKDIGEARDWRSPVAAHVAQVARNFNVDYNFLQTLLKDSSMLASCSVLFCKEMPKFLRLLLPVVQLCSSPAAMEVLLESFVKRLAFGARLELVALMEIKGVRQARAKQLYAAGFRSVKSVAEATPEALLLRIPALQQPTLVINCAKRLLEEQYREALDEAEQLNLGSQAE